MFIYQAKHAIWLMFARDIFYSLLSPWKNKTKPQDLRQGQLRRRKKNLGIRDNSLHIETKWPR